MTLSRGDDVLARDVHRDDAEVDLHHALDEGEDEEQPRAAGADEAAEAEDDAALVLLDDADREGEEGDRDDVPEGGEDAGEEVRAGNALRGGLVGRLLGHYRAPSGLAFRTLQAQTFDLGYDDALAGFDGPALSLGLPGLAVHDDEADAAQATERAMALRPTTVSRPILAGMWRIRIMFRKTKMTIEPKIAASVKTR